MKEKRILMRLGKSPFDLCSGVETYRRNTIGGNNGNLIFGAAAHKLLSVEGVEVVPNHYQISGSMADRVNDEFDGFVLPLANAFRPSFLAELRRTTEFIKRLKVPFMMLSGGAQLSLDGGHDELKSIESAVKAFATAVLDKSSALTVRGERTAEYLNSLGFRDVLVVGCPSMTMNGPEHRVEVAPRLVPGSKIAYNLQAPKDQLAQLIEQAEIDFEATYFPQDPSTLDLMLTGADPYSGKDARLPLSRKHPQFAYRRAEFHVDAACWIARMREMAFSFGPRIHGNVAAILAGTPAVVLAHDSRTLELAEYHQIPMMLDSDADSGATVQDLYDRADFGNFNKGFSARFERLAKFVNENGFSHIYEEGQEAARAAYEARVRYSAYPEPQKTVLGGNDLSRDDLVEVVQIQTRKMANMQRSMTKEIRELRKSVQDMRVSGASD